jgi:hypothetical protein
VQEGKIEVAVSSESPWVGWAKFIYACEASDQLKLKTTVRLKDQANWFGLYPK